MDIEDTGSGDGRPPGRCGKVAVSIYRYFPHGGLQKLMMDTVLELLRRNFDVTVFCMSWEAENVPENVALRRLRVSGSSNASKARKFDLALAKDFYVYESLVCVHHLLEVENLVAVVGKSSVFIEVLVE